MKSFLGMMKTQYNTKVKVIECDGELFSRRRAVREFLESKHIKIEPSAPNTQAQNGASAAPSPKPAALGCRCCPESRPQTPSATSILASIALLLPRYRLCLEYDSVLRLRSGLYAARSGTACARLRLGSLEGSLQRRRVYQSQGCSTSLQKAGVGSLWVSCHPANNACLA